MKHKVNVHFLSNGIPVIFCDVAFQTCKISVNLGFGARDEKAQEYGITHFVEHLIGQSVVGEPSFDQLKKKIEVFGGNINLYTTYSKINLFVNVLPEYLPDVVKIIAPQIVTPLFNEQNIEKEKNIILDEYRRSLGNKSWLLFKQINLFKNTGFGHYILGTPEIIKSFNKTMVFDYYFSHLSNDKCNIVVVGQVKDKQNLLSELENLFGNIPYIHYEHYIQSVQQTCEHNLKPEEKNIKLVLAFAAKIPDERKDQIAIGVFKKILQDRLRKVLRYEKGLVYTIQCATMGNIDTRLYTIETETLPENTENIIENIATVCKNILEQNLITAEELQSAKNSFKYSILREMDSVDTCCEIYAQHMMYYGKLYDVDTEKQILDNLKLNDIIKIGQSLLNAPVSIVTQGPMYDFDIVSAWHKFYIN